MELKLCKARDMLAGASPLKIIEIAYACGFGDISYFNRCFRRRFGASRVLPRFVDLARLEPGARSDRI